MALVQVQVGNNSLSLTTLPKTPEHSGVDESIEMNMSLEYSINGQARISQAGKKKRKLTFAYTNINATEYATFLNYANVAKKWWVRISGISGLDIFSAFAYIQIDKSKITRVTDTEIRRDFNLIISEI